MKRTGKWLALLMAAIMALSLMGVAAAEDDLMKPFAPYPEAITLTFARHLNLGNQLAEGETTSKNIFTDVVKDKLNVDCVIKWETAPDAYFEKLSLDIAGDDLPDVFGLEYSQYLTFRQLIDEGKLADLTDAYNTCIGGQNALELATLDGSQNNSATVDGRLWGIPSIPNGYNYNLLWVRTDWLEQVGKEMPQTVDDIKDVALAFIENKLGGDNTVGIVVDPNTILKTSHSFLSFSTVANSQGAYPNSWILRDGKAVYGTIQPEMKDALAVVADWYTAGIMDPQFMTYQNMDVVTPAIRENNCGMYFGAYWSPWTVAEARKVFPEMEWGYVKGPVDKDGNFNHINSADANGWMLVSAKCEHPEAAIKVANVIKELEAGNYNDEPEIYEAVQKSKAAGSFGRTISPIAGCGGGLSNMFDHEARMGIAIDNYVKTGALEMFPGATEDDALNCEKAYAWYQNQERDNTEGYSLYNSFMCMMDVVGSSNNHDEYVAYSYTTESMEDFWGSLFSLEEEMITQIVSGQKPLEFFDEFVGTWKASGGDIITAEVNELLGL